MPIRPSHLGILAFVAVLTTSCRPAAVPSATPAMPLIANPASVFCKEHGGRLEIREDPSGGQMGICVFADGSECDEWAYFRGECAPGESLSSHSTIPSDAATSAGAAIPEGWETYTQPGLGYSFFYPTGSTIETDDIGRSISVIGPLENDEHWPWFNIAHPNQEDYRLTEGADLETWLREKGRLPGPAQDERIIGGETALHVRQDHGPQAYDDDRFYFAHAGRIYEITILHAGKEDWSVYDRFLDSFRFE